ncbi:MAG: exodeoxyribonuclease VII small subunit [Polyangiaceae bacterium]
MAASDEKKTATFETSLKRLGEIVDSLEKGDLPLEDSLKLFEEGTKLARLAQDRLNKAEKRIDELLGVDEDGNPKTQPFDDDADSSSARGGER